MSVALQKQPQEVLWKKVLLKILEISQKHPVLESLFDKVAVQFYESNYDVWQSSKYAYLWFLF